MSDQDRIAVSLLLLAKARELVGSSSVSLSLPSSISRYSDLVSCILEAQPVLERLGGTFVLSVNENYVDQDSLISLSAGDELAVIPPISGG